MQPAPCSQLDQLKCAQEPSKTRQQSMLGDQLRIANQLLAGLFFSRRLKDQANKCLGFTSVYHSVFLCLIKLTLISLEFNYT